MWDLETIIAQNNQAAIDFMMKGREVDVAQSPQPEVWSLTLLAQKLQVGPPSLAVLMESFTDYDTLKAFLEIIRRYLPEHEDEILSATVTQRAYKFCYLFGKKYFPLPPYAFTTPLAQLTENMPIDLMGMSYSAYHGLVMRRGYILLLSLVIYPYEGHWRDLEDDDVPFDPFAQISGWKPRKSDIDWVKNLLSSLADGGRWVAPMGFTVTKVDDRNIEIAQAENTPEVRDTVHRTVLVAEKAGINVRVKVGKTAYEKQDEPCGARVPLLDLVQQHVGDGLTSLIPKNGWTPESLHQWTDGTAYEGVGDFADWACSQTGCIILDYSYDDCAYIEGYSEPIFKWSQFNVDELTKEAAKVREIREKIDRVVEWLEVNPDIRFRELLHFLTAKASTSHTEDGKKKSYTWDDTERWCPLDQKDEEEEYDEDEVEARLQRATIEG